MRQKEADLCEALELALQSHDNILSVVHVGSSAERRALPGSDIDLAVVVESPPEKDHLCLETSSRDVDIQFFDSSWLTGIISNPFLDLRGLREAGRISRGKILYNKWEPMVNVASACKRALVSPLEASVLLSQASRALNTSVKLPPKYCAWQLLGAAIGLAIFGVSITHRRYQKPKWLARDLRSSGSGQLTHSIVELFGISGYAGASSLVDSVRTQVNKACALRNLPPLLRIDGPCPETYLFLRDAMRDAAILLEQDEWEGACIIAAISIRYALVLLEGASTKREVPENKIRAWIKETLSTVIPRQGAVQLELCAEQLLSEGRRLESKYRRSIKHGFPKFHDSTQIPSERSSLLGLARVCGPIWIGSHQQDPALLRMLGLSTVAFTAVECQPSDEEMGPLDIRRVPLEEGPLTQEAAELAKAMAIKLAEDIPRLTGHLLISSHQGMNRSALVAGMTLRHASNLSGADVLVKLRRTRRGVLSNDLYCSALVS